MIKSQQSRFGPILFSSIALAALICLGTIDLGAQVDKIIALVPLESSRIDVERILGKPENRFDTYATYQTEEAKFAFWYAEGKCQKKREGVQYDVPDGRLTRIEVLLDRFAPLAKYVDRKEDLRRVPHPKFENRAYYFVPDESMILGIIMPKGKDELVESIDIQPGIKKRHLRCDEN